MKPHHFRLLGFDIRLHREDYLNSQWNTKRRESYLLRPSVDWPLSVDSLGWPSVFFPKLYGSKSIIEVDKETEYDMCWLDLAAMRAAFEGGWKARTPGVQIGIYLFVPADLTSEQFGSLILEKHPTPPECPGGSKLLGYDVADSGFISGLSSCGYLPEERHRWRADWQDHLNDFGLLRTTEAALKFAEATDQRVPEHASLYVFGLWRLPT